MEGTNEGNMTTQTPMDATTFVTYENTVINGRPTGIWINRKKNIHFTPSLSLDLYLKKDSPGELQSAQIPSDIIRESLTIKNKREGEEEEEGEDLVFIENEILLFL